MQVYKGRMKKLEVTTQQKIEQRLEKIKEKHSAFFKSQALAVLVEEVGEVANAIQDKNEKALKYELLDVIAFAIRWYEEME